MNTIGASVLTTVSTGAIVPRGLGVIDDAWGLGFGVVIRSEGVTVGVASSLEGADVGAPDDQVVGDDVASIMHAG